MTRSTRRTTRGRPAAAARPPVPEARPGDAVGPVAVSLMAAVYVAVVFGLCVGKYREYLYRDFDLAIFTQAVAQILRGSLFSSIRGMNVLGDHSSLVLFVLAPLYAAVRHPLTLVFAETTAMALGAWPLYALARHEGLRESTAVVLAAIYLLHPALVYGNLYEFHPEHFATSALIAAFCFLRASRRGVMLVCAAVALSCKEDVALVVLAMAVYACVARRDRRLAYAVPLAGLALASLVVSLVVLKPMLNQGESSYARMYGAWGATPGQMLGAMLAHPDAVVTSFFTTLGDPGDTVVKQLYYVQMLLPVMALALMSPLALLTALPIVAEHFMSSRYQQHTIVFQYTALVIPSLAVASVLGLRRLAGPSGRGARGAAPGTREHALATATLACSIGANLLYGPLIGHGVLMRVPAPEALRPSSVDRALKPWRDRFAAAVPAGTGVAAGFEMLPRFADRPLTQSLHHVLQGRYTFSTRPFETPTGIGAVIAELGDERLAPYIQPGSGARLAALLAANGLAPSDAAGDLVLFTKAPARPLALVEPGGFAPTAPTAIVFDGALEYRGCDPIRVTTHAGEPVTVATYWRRRTPIDRVYLTELALFDSDGNVRGGRSRVLGYGAWPPDSWPADTTVRERTGFVLPADLAPGRYTLAFGLAWHLGSRRGQAAPDVPGPDRPMALGEIEVESAGRGTR